MESHTLQVTLDRRICLANFANPLLLADLQSCRLACRRPRDTVTSPLLPSPPCTRHEVNNEMRKWQVRWNWSQPPRNVNIEPLPPAWDLSSARKSAFPSCPAGCKPLRLDVTWYGSSYCGNLKVETSFCRNCFVTLLPSLKDSCHWWGWLKIICKNLNLKWNLMLHCYQL